MVGAKEKNLEICLSRLPENAFVKMQMSLKNSSTTTDILDKSHDVVLKLHENCKQT